jgi:hypothetical protein
VNGQQGVEVCLVMKMMARDATQGLWTAKAQPTFKPLHLGEGARLMVIGEKKLFCESATPWAEVR